MDRIAELIEPQIPALRRYAWALLHNSDAADDLVQDCLERAISRWHLRRRDGDLRGWLFAIVHNLAVTRGRRLARSGVQVSLDETPTSIVVEASQEDRLAVRDVLSGLELLPIEQREVLLLVGVEDMSYADAAKVLDIPVGTVMSRLNRGRESLRQYLETGRTPLRRVK
jgi:RNA polymerase sigma-70 factor (ECF subfamily)